MDLRWCVVLLAIFHSGSALKCLQCEEVSHPRYCQVVAECGAGEVCFVESIVTQDGANAYRIGCSFGNTEKVCHGSTSHRCTECCNTDLCNAGLCGESGYPQDRGPLCYSCPSRLDSEDCNRIDFCDLDEVCYVNTRTVFGDKLFERGCAHKHLCSANTHGINPGTIIGKRERPDMLAVSLDSHPNYSGTDAEDVFTDDNCHKCCGQDLCNSGCDGPNTTAIATPPPTTTSTTTTARPTSTTTTTTSSSTTTTATTTPTTTRPAVDNTTLRDCYDILKANLSSGDGLYTIYVNNSDARNTLVPVQVYCDMTKDGGGWTVFQYRFDGSVMFYHRNFTEYEKGFGQWPGEFWLGLQWQHMITLQKRYQLRVEFTAKRDNRTDQLRYSTFSIGPASNYTLTVSGFSGHGYDAMTYHSGHRFVAYNNDDTKNRCTVTMPGAFWFAECFYANLNGRYADWFEVFTLRATLSGEIIVGSSMSVKPR